MADLWRPRLRLYRRNHGQLPKMSDIANGSKILWKSGKASYKGLYWSAVHDCANTLKIADVADCSQKSQKAARPRNRMFSGGQNSLISYAQLGARKNSWIYRFSRGRKVPNLCLRKEFVRSFSFRFMHLSYSECNFYGCVCTTYHVSGGYYGCSSCGMQVL